MLPVAPPSPNYIPSLEEPHTSPAPQDEDEHEPTFIQPHDPDFVPEPIYPEYIPLEDEHILLAEEQPLPHVDYPMDGGDDGDDDNGNSSGDDADDEDEDEEDDEEEEEHLAPTDSAVFIPTDELVSPPEGIEPVIPPPSTNTATTEPRVAKHNLLRGGISVSRISSLRSIGDGMCRGGGSGGDGNASRAVHLAKCSLTEGGDSEASGDGDGVGMAR
nr:hypothetical protein [Tanacetum cinerariifolium]